MESIEAVGEKVLEYVQAGEIEAAERFIDALAESDPQQLDRQWGVGTNMSQYCLLLFYNSIGVSYKDRGGEAFRQHDADRVMIAAFGAERCHEKAFDMVGMSADDIMYLPGNYPFNKHLIYTLWALGSAKYVLRKTAESRKYLLLCLRIPAPDPEAEQWQSEASHYLRLLDGKPVQIAVNAQDVMPNLLEPKLLQVKGKLLEWGAYTMPLQDKFVVYVDDAAIDYFERHGFENPIDLEGHVLVLVSDDTGDLHHPLLIVEVV